MLGLTQVNLLRMAALAAHTAPVRHHSCCITSKRLFYMPAQHGMAATGSEKTNTAVSAQAMHTAGQPLLPFIAPPSTRGVIAIHKRWERHGKHLGVARKEGVAPHAMRPLMPPIACATNQPINMPPRPVSASSACANARVSSAVAAP